MGGLTWAWYSRESSFHNNNKICFCCCCCVCVSGRALEGWRTVELLVWMSWVKIPILRPLLQSALKHSTHTHTHTLTPPPQRHKERYCIPSTLESVRTIYLPPWNQSFKSKLDFNIFFLRGSHKYSKYLGGVGGKSFIYLFQTGVPCM